MTILLPFPELTSNLAKDASVGSIVAGALIVVFLLLALGFGVFQVRRMKRRMNMLDDETRARRAKQLELDEEICAITSGTKPAAPKQMKDPWQS